MSGQQIKSGAGLARLMASAVGLCTVVSLPLQAVAQEAQQASEQAATSEGNAAAPAATASPESSDADEALADLLAEESSAEAEPAAAAPVANGPPPGTQADGAAPATATQEPAVAGDLPTIPVDVPPDEALPALKEAPQHAQIEEIVVTATKREQSLREIPAAITALSGADLEKQGIQGVEDISRLVPGVTVNTPSEGATRVTIRGIAASAATNATTGVLFGDVSFSDAYLPRAALDPNPFDLKSVEVLKGPQGTLFGAGALNGAIRYVPEPPKFGEWEAKYFVQYTSVEQGDAAPIYGAAVNLPFLGDKAALRLMAFDRESPGFIDNSQLGDDVNRIDQRGLRAILGWRPNDDWDTALTYAWQETDQADFPIADNLDGRLSTDNRPRHSTAHVDYDFADLVIKRHFDWAELVSDTSYVQKRSNSFFDASSRLPGNGQTALRASQPDESGSRTLGQELRLVSTDDSGSPWSWAVGAFGWRQEIESQPELQASVELPGGLNGLSPLLYELIDGLAPGAGDLIAEDGSLVLARIRTNAEIREMALFGDITRRLGESVELSVGGRLYRTTSGGSVRQTGLLILASGQPEQGIDGELEEQGFNPKVSLLWHASDSIIVYGGASKGFRAGGIQPGYQLNPAGQSSPDFFKSDTIWSYEAGLRTDWFEGAMHFDITAFFTDWKDPQVFQLGTNGLTSYIDNAGGVESKGVEMALQTLLPYGFMLSVSGSWTDTVTTKPFTAQDGSTVAPGQEWPFAPHLQTAATLAYTGNVRDWDLSASVTHSFLGKAWSSLEDSQKQEIFDFQQIDLQFGVANPALRWLPEVSFLVNNALDERGVANQFRGGTYVDVTYLRPRAFTLRLSGNF
ncbi:MAG TPA: TonB-dependent receptor [Solimonas sp.]|nr:TonB-dependent receptor [Solimonas sp.]